MLKLLRTYTGIPPNCCSMVLFLWCSAEKDAVSSSLFRTVATKWVAGSGNKNHTNHAQTKRSFNLPTIILQEPMLILGRVIFSKKNCRKVVWSDFLWSLQKKKACVAREGPGHGLQQEFWETGVLVSALYIFMLSTVCLCIFLVVSRCSRRCAVA